jgi:hypothetical protein
MIGNGTTEVARTQQNRLIAARKAENFSDFIAELAYNIAVSLLAKAAEAVQILPNLRSGKPKLLRQFRRRNPCYPPFLSDGKEIDNIAAVCGLQTWIHSHALACL